MRFAARYPGCYFHEQCVYLGNAIAVIGGVCCLTRSRWLQGMWRKIQLQQCFASATRIHLILLSKRIFQHLFCSAVSGQGSLKARKNPTHVVLNLAGAKASKAPDAGEQLRNTERSELSS